MDFSKNLNFSKIQKPLNLNYKKFGKKGINFLMLHGLFGSFRNWITLASSLKEKFQVWTLDARNHGASPHSDRMNYQTMSEDVISFLNNKGIEKIILLGHSMGGKTAMHLSLNFHHRILALIVIDIAPVKYTNFEEHQKIIKSMKGIKFNPELTRAEIEKTLTKTLHDQQVISFLMTNIVRHKNQFKWRIGLEEIAGSIPVLSDFPKQDKCFLGPTKFIRGESSDFISTNNYQLIKDLFPKSSILTLKNCGHWPNHEDPLNLQKEVKNFLKESSLL